MEFETVSDEAAYIEERIDTAIEQFTTTDGDVDLGISNLEEAHEAAISGEPREATAADLEKALDAAYAGDETRHIGELQNISIALAMVQIVEEQ